MANSCSAVVRPQLHQEEIAISANINSNPGLSVGSYLNMQVPSDPNPASSTPSSNPTHSWVSAEPERDLTFGSNGLPNNAVANGGVSVGIFPSTMPTQRVHHYSFDMQYDLGRNYVMSLGYQGSLSRDLFFHENPQAVPATSGYAPESGINGGDYWARAAVPTTTPCSPN